VPPAVCGPNERTRTRAKIKEKTVATSAAVIVTPQGPERLLLWHSGVGRKPHHTLTLQLKLGKPHDAICAAFWFPLLYLEEPDNDGLIENPWRCVDCCGVLVTFEKRTYEIIIRVGSLMVSVYESEPSELVTLAKAHSHKK